jgi:signal transduction histidine kinase
LLAFALEQVAGVFCLISFAESVFMDVARMKKQISPFYIALFLLCVSGVAATVTIIHLYTSEALVNHTYAVEVSIGDVESALAEVGRHRVAYVDSGSTLALEDFKASTFKVAQALAQVRQLTRDNPAEQTLCSRLELNARERMAPSFNSVELRRQSQSDPRKELQLTSEVAKAARQTALLLQEMRQNEDRLLELRNHNSRFLYTASLWILMASFASSAFMFWIHYRLLNRELRERRTVENHLRKLSGDLMRVQDDERKRFARELHDGLGQNMVAAKIAIDNLLKHYPGEPELKELAALLDDLVSQTRTISYLLHPPLLDELGLASAVKWLIEGYTKRTEVEITLHISAQIDRLPRYFEVALFRILQEALTNIHRHSKSAKAEVSIQVNSHEVSLFVRDYGKGIPPETLANFKANGTHVGVGLAGMRERVRELGGKLEIKSDHTGTEITVKIPGAEVELPPEKTQLPSRSAAKRNVNGKAVEQIKSSSQTLAG